MTTNSTILPLNPFCEADFRAIRLAEIAAFSACQRADANLAAATAQAKAARAVWQRCITQYDTALDLRARANAPANPFAVAAEVVETEDEAIASRASEDASAYLRNRILDNAY